MYGNPGHPTNSRLSSFFGFLRPYKKGKKEVDGVNKTSNTGCRHFFFWIIILSLTTAFEASVHYGHRYAEPALDGGNKL